MTELAVAPQRSTRALSSTGRPRDSKALASVAEKGQSWQERGMTVAALTTGSFILSRREESRAKASESAFDTRETKRLLVDGCISEKGVCRIMSQNALPTAGQF